MFKEYTCIIEGYYRYEKRSSISDEAGVYFVFTAKRTKEQKVNLEELIYIGQSKESIRTRIGQHEKMEEWAKYAQEKGSYLYFACTVNNAKHEDINRIEASYIYEHDTRFNENLKDEFRYDKTKVESKFGKDRSTNLIKTGGILPPLSYIAHVSENVGGR